MEFHSEKHTLKGGSEDLEVDGYTYDFLAYRDRSTRHSCGCRDVGFTVTHLPTGFACGTFSKAEAARHFITEAAKLETFRAVTANELPEDLKTALKTMQDEAAEKTGAKRGTELIECYKCKNDISDECPECGCTCGGN